MKTLIEFIENLSAAELAEVRKNWAEYFSIEFSTREELIELVQDSDFSWTDAQAEGYSPREFIFWWV